MSKVLPPNTVDALRGAYVKYVEAGRGDKRPDAGARLANLIAKGRKHGWSFPALSDAIGAVDGRPKGVSAERLRQIVVTFDGDPSKARPAFPAFRDPKPVLPPKVKPPKPTLTTEEHHKLKELPPLAAKNSGARDRDSIYRRASEELTEVIADAHDRGVTWREISEATDGALTVAGLRMRIARHGRGGSVPPTVQPYKGIVITQPKRQPLVDAPAAKSKTAKSA